MCDICESNTVTMLEKYSTKVYYLFAIFPLSHTVCKDTIVKTLHLFSVEFVPWVTVPNLRGTFFFLYQQRNIIALECS